MKVEEGVISTYLCHIANIASRVGRPLETNPSNGKTFDREAMKLWGREYKPGWEPNV